MKKIMTNVAIAATLSIGIFAPAKSQGIPVIDVAGLTQTVLQYQQMVQQYAVLRDQLTSQAKQLESLTGARGMGALFSNPLVQAQMPKDWQKLYSTIKNKDGFKLARAKLPKSPNPEINAIFDQVASTQATMQEMFDKTQMRLQQIQDLQGQIDSASDPAAKADLQNRLVSEQNSIAGTSQLLEVMNKMAEQDKENARQAAHRAYVCKQFRKDCPTN